MIFNTNMLLTSLQTLPTGARSPAPADSTDHRAPLAHGLVGVMGLTVGALLLVRASDDLARGAWATPAVLGAVHALTLGWLLTLVVGMLYQLGPVALRVMPRAPRLWRVVLPLHIGGVVLVVWGVSVGRLHTATHGWSLLLIATLSSAVMLLGPWRAPPDTRDRMRLVTWGFIALGVTLLLGASRLLWGWRGFTPDLAGLRLAHLAFGLGGFGTLIGWALGSHVLPMFLGTRATPQRSSRWIPWLLLGGAAVSLPALLPEFAVLRSVSVLVMAAGQALIVWHGLQWFRGRANRVLDPALAVVALAFVALSLATLLQLVLALGALFGTPFASHVAWPRAFAVWGVLFLAGWLALLVAGVLLRVFVFLSWMVRAGPGTARAARVPARVSEFARPPLAWASVALFASGLLLLSVTIAVGSESGARLGAMLYSGAAIAMSLHHVLALFASPRSAAPASRTLTQPLVRSHP